MTPKTYYARSGGVHIAYQVVGQGPFDLVYVPGWVSHVELAWDEPAHARFFERLASFSRLILFDKRGTGLSDRVPDNQLPMLDERMDDLRAVMDAVACARAAVFGVSEGGNMCALFAATHPERTTALVVANTYAKRIWSPDYPWAPTPEVHQVAPLALDDAALGFALPERALATVLFTDIVDSTDTAARLGDRAWRDVLERHHAIARREIERFRGREINTSGDGFFATFDGPARAIRCACAIRDAVRPLGVAIRAGAHTGEVDLAGHDVGGIAVHIGARVAAAAGTGEVLVSSTVKDLVAGAGLAFNDRGTHRLKGVPGEWRLFAVG